MGKVEEKVACQYCGKEYSKAGIANHEKSCPENPANKEVKADEEVKETEVKAPATVEAKADVVKVKMKESIECYIGDRYYRLKAQEEYEVPENVKEILKKSGMLDAM